MPTVLSSSLIAAAALALAPAVAAPAGPATQRLEPVTCAAEPNFVTRERFPIEGEVFRFSGSIEAGAFDPKDFTPFASVALLQQDRPEELSAVLSVHPSTGRRYDVTLRRHINKELRERSVIGRVPAGGPVPFELALTEDRQIRFRLGEVEQRVPLGDFRPDAILLGCSSGTFTFEDLAFDGQL